MLKHAPLVAVYDSTSRSFSAAVNTVIYLHGAPGNLPTQRSSNWDVAALSKSLSRFVMWKMDYTDAAYAAFLIEQEGLRENTFREQYRVIVKSVEDLFNAGWDEEDKTYAGDKWGGKYLSAPEIYYRIHEAAKESGQIEPISNYFTGERYLNTGGADGFFIIDEFEQEKEFTALNKKGESTFSGRIENEFFKPLIKDYVKKNRSIVIDGYDALCFVPDPALTPAAKRYIHWGVGEGYDNKSVTKTQTPWYKPTNQMKIGAEFIIPRSFNETFVVYFNPKKYLSLRYYRLHQHKGSMEYSILLFNSTIMALHLETLGNKALGQGALDFFMEGFLRMNFPFVRFEPNKKMMQMLTRPIQSIFKELGFDQASDIREQDPKPLPDRAALDTVVFDALGLTQDERKEIYWATAELVQQRLNKAASR